MENKKESSKTKDNKSWLLYEYNNGIPVKCEREDWQSCPEHKHLSLTPDFDRFSIGNEIDEVVIDDPNDNITSLKEYEEDPALSARSKKEDFDTKRLGDYKVIKGNVEYLGGKKYLLDKEVYKEAQENCENRIITPSTKIGLIRSAGILGGVGAISGGSMALLPLGPIAVIPLIVAGLAAGMWAVYKKPQYTGDINGQDFVKQEAYLKEYAKLKGIKVSDIPVQD